MLLISFNTGVTKQLRLRGALTLASTPMLPAVLIRQVLSGALVLGFAFPCCPA